MATSRRRWLMLLGVTAAIAAATSADADMGAASGRAKGVVRVKFVEAPSRGSRPASRRADGAYAREIAEAAARYAVPERLIRAVILVESRFDRRAVSPSGARGLMQLMPETAAILGVHDPFDPRQNIDGGTRHLRAMMVRFRHDVRLAVAAYNAGEGPVAAYGGVPPYPETREYVAQVLRFYNASIEWHQSAGRDARRIVQPDGTIVYTNIRYGQLAAEGR